MSVPVPVQPKATGMPGMGWDGVPCFLSSPPPPVFRIIHEVSMAFEGNSTWYMERRPNLQILVCFVKQDSDRHLNYTTLKTDEPILAANGVEGLLDVFELVGG